MSIIYNGTDLSDLVYKGVNISEVYVCDTSTTCCVRVFPKTVTYNYCAFDYSVNLDFTCSMHCYCTAGWHGCLTNGNSNSYNKLCIVVAGGSGTGDFNGGIKCGHWYTTNTCCVDASPTCVYCKSGTSCIQVYTLSTWQTNALNVANCNCYYTNHDTTLSCFSCNFVYGITTTSNSIEYPAVKCCITGERETGSPWYCWCSDVTVDCPQNSRYVVMVCITDGASTVLACCPISNSSGSITIDLP